MSFLYSKNEIFGFETDTVWGVGCNPLNGNLVNKIYDLKQRDKNKPLILMSNKLSILLPYIKTIPNYAYKLIEQFWPGRVTFIFEKSDLCPNFITRNQNTIGVRIPNNNNFSHIIDNLEDGILATTSLNISNNPPITNYNEANKQFGNIIKVIRPISENKVKGISSTIISCVDEKPQILRQGDVKINQN